jgi:hypothetical protein
MEKFTLKEAINLIGDGATYRTVNYYKDLYVNDVIKVDGRYFVTQDFINKVIKNRENAKKTISEPRTKTELLKEIEDLKKGNNQQSNQDLLKEIRELKEIIEDYENSEVYEKAKEGFRVEVFTQDEYDLFSERLIQWRLQRQEIEQTKVHFESLQDERDFIKGQLEYFKQSNDRILLQHEKLIEVIGQRNRIEAVEKGAIPKEPREV